jgi:hypothetical protein
MSHRTPADGDPFRIVEMDTWDNAFLDLVEEAYITFQGGLRQRDYFRCLRGFSMFATARMTDRHAPSFLGKEMTKAIRLAVADGQPSEPAVVSSAISISTMATIQDSSANEPEFFNILLGLPKIVDGHPNKLNGVDP